MIVFETAVDLKDMGCVIVYRIETDDMSSSRLFTGTAHLYPVVTIKDKRLFRHAKIGEWVILRPTTLGDKSGNEDPVSALSNVIDSSKKWLNQFKDKSRTKMQFHVHNISPVSRDGDRTMVLSEPNSCERQSYRVIRKDRLVRVQ